MKKFLAISLLLSSFINLNAASLSSSSYLSSRGKIESEQKANFEMILKLAIRFLIRETPIQQEVEKKLNDLDSNLGALLKLYRESAIRLAHDGTPEEFMIAHLLPVINFLDKKKKMENTSRDLFNLILITGRQNDMDDSTESNIENTTSRANGSNNASSSSSRHAVSRPSCSIQ